MSFYLLNKEYALRGWDKLPWAFVRQPGNEAMFLSKQDFELLSLCNGKIDLDLPIFSDAVRAAADRIAKGGYVTKRETPGELAPEQEYKKYPNRYIMSAHWSVTGKCNYRCKHCFMSAPDAKLGELDHDTIMGIARQIVECGIGEVSLTGGEPLVRKDFLEIVEYLVSHNVRISQIYSNGALVNEKLLTALKDMGVCCMFNMSYDGTDGWHDWLRGMKDAEEKVLRAFDLCYEMGFPTGSEMCIHKGNRHLLRETVNRLAEHHCLTLKTNPVSDTELWQRYSVDYSLTMPEVFALYLDYIPHFFEDGMPISLQLGGFFQCGRGETDYEVPSNHVHCSANPGRAAICGHARQNLYISPEGRMLPCMPLSSMRMQENYPRVQDVGLAAGLTDSEYMRLIDTRVDDYLAHNPQCAACEYKYTCGGGCRGSALATSPDDILGPDKAACLMNRGRYAERVKQTADAAIAALHLGEEKN